MGYFGSYFGVGSGGGGTTPFSGPNSVTLNFKDGSGNPIPDARFAVDGKGWETDGTGSITIGLSNGNHSVVATAANMLWTPQTIAVNPLVSFDIIGAFTAPPSPPSSTQAIIRLLCRKGDGSLWPGTVVQYRPTLSANAANSNAGQGFDRGWSQSNATGADGIANCTVPVGKEMEYRLGNGASVAYRAATSATINFPFELDSKGQS